MLPTVKMRPSGMCDTRCTLELPCVPGLSPGLKLCAFAPPGCDTQSPRVAAVARSWRAGVSRFIALPPRSGASFQAPSLDAQVRRATQRFWISRLAFLVRYRKPAENTMGRLRLGELRQHPPPPHVDPAVSLVHERVPAI